MEKGILVRTEFDEITYKIIGAAMRVHNKLGPGLKEAHYQRAMEQALKEVKLNFEPQKQIGVYFHNTLAGLLFIDILVEGCIVVELKAFSHMLTKNELAQTLTYLKTSGCGSSDWRFVYKFKGQESRFGGDDPPNNISCCPL